MANPSWEDAQPLAACGVPRGRVSLRAHGYREGLENLAVNQLVQDSSGFLWVGTQGGLFRFDGQRFREYGIKDGLPSTSIPVLCAASSGGLWVGMEHGGLGRLQDGRFEMLACGPDVRPGRVRAMVATSDGSLWVGCTEGLFLSRGGGPLVSVVGWPGGPVISLAEGRTSGAVWVHGQGALHLLCAEGLLRRLEVEQGFISSERSALVVDAANRLWVRTLEGMQSLAEGAPWLENHLGLLPPVSDECLSLQLSPQGFLLATSEEGVHRLSLKGRGEPIVSDVIQARGATAVLEDREGSLWFGAEGALFQSLGLSRVRVFGMADGLPHDTIWALHRSPDGALWVGTEAGVCRYSSQGWELIPGTRGFRPYAITSSSDGLLWIGGNQGFFLRYDSGTGRCERVGVESGIQVQCILRMLWDRQGQLWLATRWDGLWVGKNEGDRWRFNPVALPPASGPEDVRGVADDYRGRILVTGSQGLSIFDGNRWTRFGEEDGLRHRQLESVVALRDGSLCVTHTETLGISILLAERGGLEILRHLDSSNGLASNRAYSACEDAWGRLWIGTGNGVTCIAGEHLECFTVEDGLAGNDCDLMSFLAESDGAVWIGSSTGLSRVQVRRAEVHHPPLPESHIQALFISGKPLSVNQEEPVVLPRSHSTVEIHVAALSFLNERKLEHQVQLVGLEKGWQTLGGHVARYPSLPRGRYTFRVRSRRKGEPWGAEATLSFEVLPNWWERSWVRTWLWRPLLESLGEGVLKRLNDELEAKVEESTAELRSKSQMLDRMNQRLLRANEDMDRMLGIAAHDLRNPLSAISLYADLLDEETDPEESRKAARKIKLASVAMNELIRRLLDVSRIEAGKLGFQILPIEPVPLATSVLEGFRTKAREKGIELELNLHGEPQPVLADPFYLTTALENLISNAVKFTEPGPPVRCVVLALSPGRFVVNDQGPGFSEEDKAKAFARFARLSARPTGGESSTGLGLNIVKTVVEAMGGSLSLESTAGQGATFTIGLPLA